MRSFCLPQVNQCSSCWIFSFLVWLWNGKYIFCVVFLSICSFWLLLWYKQVLRNMYLYRGKQPLQSHRGEVMKVLPERELLVLCGTLLQPGGHSVFLGAHWHRAGWEQSHFLNIRHGLVGNWRSFLFWLHELLKSQERGKWRTGIHLGQLNPRPIFFFHFHLGELYFMPTSYPSAYTPRGSLYKLIDPARFVIKDVFPCKFFYSYHSPAITVKEYQVPLIQNHWHLHPVLGFCLHTVPLVQL